MLDTDTSKMSVLLVNLQLFHQSSVIFVYICLQVGFTALHRAIIAKKQAITNYLLRESANPFVRDKVS